MCNDLFLKRIYDPYNHNDGYRVLVDRLWPRGKSKVESRLDEWAKVIAPSSDLRKWFGHKPERFVEFKQKYLVELRAGERQRRKLEELSQLALTQRVTLLYGAKDPIYNHGIILSEEIRTLMNSKLSK